MVAVAAGKYAAEIWWSAEQHSPAHETGQAGDRLGPAGKNADLPEDSPAEREGTAAAGSAGHEAVAGP